MQRGFATGFALRRQRGVGRRDAGVGRGVPDSAIDAIQDARHVGAPRLDHTFQPAAKFFGGHFAGVVGADCGDSVRTGQACLHEGELAVELQP